MGLPNEVVTALIGAANQGRYEIEQSLRFDGSSYLSRTPSSSGSRTTWTVSCWVKRAKLSTAQYIWSAGTSDVTYLNFQSDDTLKLRNGSGSVEYVTNWKFRDPSAWYHLVVKWDTTNGTQADRAIIYVNGVALTTGDYSQYDKATASENSSGWNTNVVHAFGHYTYNSSYKNQAYLSEVNFVDGTALDATDFGKYDGNGVWSPIAYSGSYGSNGFYLKFDSSATNGIGHDHSGNGNNWTPSGFYTSEGTGNYIASDEMNASWQNLPYGSMDGTTTTAGYSGTSSVTYTPPSAVSYNTLEVKFGNGNNVTSKQGSELKINGTTVARVPTGTGGVGSAIYSTSTAGSFTSISSGPPNPGEYGCTIFYIKVNGSMLVDNTASAIYNDVKEDTPTNNWCTLNPLDQRLTDNGTISDGNLTYDQSSTGGRTGRGTIGVSSGKWYWEFIPLNTGNMNVGVTLSTSDLGVYVGDDSLGWSYVASGHKSFNTETTYGSSYTWGDVIGVALDMDAGTITFYKNGVSQGQAFSGITGTVFPSAGTSNVSNCSFSLNFGQRPFTYTPPTGYNSICTANLPAPDIADGSDGFETVLDTGSNIRSSAQSTFSDGLWWIKDRANSNQHQVIDSQRGTTTRWDMPGNTAQTTYSAPSGNSVAWCWSAPNSWSNASGTNGATIASAGYRNLNTGFSIAQYTGNRPNTIRVAHGLNTVPDFIITRYLLANSYAPFVYHKDTGTFYGNWLEGTYGGSSSSDYAVVNSQYVEHRNTATSNETGTNGMIMYSWSAVPGYSAFGKYSGNSSTDGPFIYTGFRPKWIITRGLYTSGAPSDYNWRILDTDRDTYNGAWHMLWSNKTDYEAQNVDSNNVIDLLSNGFKIRTSSVEVNNSSGPQYIWAAFAENPFGGSGVSPATAR